ncbi:MAG: 1,4-dihydroxy-2-naphthoate octaprenyltransferase [Bdellovibrionales bacterium]|nr:1,4-dihydroxy-2-naphthoate octaprenyltransferase [Bdellovibrionales bacterium]
MSRNLPRSLVQSIFFAFRPKTLTAGLIPCLAGSALAYHNEKLFDGFVLLYAILASVFIQIGTNLVNDAVDFKKGADSDSRLGPWRITQSGVLSAQTVMLLAGLCFVVALACGVPLVLRGGLPIILIGLISILLGYSYTAGPLPLAYLGLGDLFVVLFFGLVAVNGMYFLQTLSWSMTGVVLGLQIGLHAAVLIAINNLRDIQGDRLVNKKTLAVRLGVTAIRYEIASLSLGPFLLGLYWWVNGSREVALFSLLSLPLALLIVKNIFQNEPSPLYNRFLGQSAALHLSFGTLASLGLWIF